MATNSVVQSAVNRVLASFDDPSSESQAAFLADILAAGKATTPDNLTKRQATAIIDAAKSAVFSAWLESKGYGKPAANGNNHGHVTTQAEADAANAAAPAPAPVAAEDPPPFKPASTGQIKFLVSLGYDESEAQLMSSFDAYHAIEDGIAKRTAARNAASAPAATPF